MIFLSCLKQRISNSKQWFSMVSPKNSIYLRLNLVGFNCLPLCKPWRLSVLPKDLQQGWNSSQEKSQNFCGCLQSLGHRAEKIMGANMSLLLLGYKLRKKIKWDLDFYFCRHRHWVYTGPTILWWRAIKKILKALKNRPEQKVFLTGGNFVLIEDLS